MRRTDSCLLSFFHFISGKIMQDRNYQNHVKQDDKDSTKTANKKKTLHFISLYLWHLALSFLKHISVCRKTFAIKTALRQYKVNKNTGNAIVKDNSRRCSGFGKDMTGKKHIWLNVSRIQQIRPVLSMTIMFNWFNGNMDDVPLANDESVLQFSWWAHFLVLDEGFSNWQLHIDNDWLTCH